MRRTQITLTEAQYRLLRDESAASGHSLAELIRQAVDQHYEELSVGERLALVDSAFGGWADRNEGGEDFVERVRTGTQRRLERA
jgi:hypothetical protein